MRVGWLGNLLLAAVVSLGSPLAAAAPALTVAAAADLRVALDEIVTSYGQAHPGDRIEVVYGSSGQLYAQIRQGAPFDLYLSADKSYPQQLARDGMAASPLTVYARGRIVLWSARIDVSKLTLKELAEPRFKRIAIANPGHAPYGIRAQQALQASGMWNQLQHRLIYGENIGQTVQFVRTGNAQVGIIALSQALEPALAEQGGYALIPDTLYQPLDQAFVITRRAAANPVARSFARFILSLSARRILLRHGFSVPDADATPHP